MIVQAADIDSLAWDKQQGLLPAIVQHATSGAVLMLAYMNRESLDATFERGCAVFYSRSRQRLWQKGEVSGNALRVTGIHCDCDRDTLLLSALPSGPVCHEGTVTCFGDEPTNTAAAVSFLPELEQVIDARIAGNDPGESYTARLHAKGTRHVAQKVGEEGLEVALAATSESDERLLSESADLLFHLLVLLRGRGLGLEDVAGELRARHTHSVNSRRGDARR
ncbi:MAG: bifunctional phosphoribosyl-AMP cyclohydrolase/phosphoribosyl-ATP diphosphatase HisIE [Steroidobacteraceae bacterium]